jgi:hypothetical protein
VSIQSNPPYNYPITKLSLRQSISYRQAKSYKQNQQTSENVGKSKKFQKPSFTSLTTTVLGRKNVADIMRDEQQGQKQKNTKEEVR